MTDRTKIPRMLLSPDKRAVQDKWPAFGPFVDWAAKRADAAEHDPSGIRAEIARLGEVGLITACAPRDYKGQNLGLGRETAYLAYEVLRQLGYANLSVARLFEGHMNAAKLVMLYGSQELKDRIFKQVIAERMLLGVWAVDGSQPLTYETKLGNAVMFNGSKAFASGLGCVGQAIVTAQAPGCDGENQLFLVKVSDENRQDPSAWRADGMKATFSGVFCFDGMAGSADDKLGSPHDYEREPHFEGGIWRYCAAHLGGIQALIDATLDVLERRKQTSAPLHLARMGSLIARCMSVSALLRELSKRIEETDECDRAASERAAANAKLARAATSDLAIDALEQCERSMGTIAHMAGNSVNRICRDLTLYIRQACQDEKLLTGAELLISDRHVAPLW